MPLDFFITHVRRTLNSAMNIYRMCERDPHSDDLVKQLQQRDVSVLMRAIRWAM